MINYKFGNNQNLIVQCKWLLKCNPEKKRNLDYLLYLKKNFFFMVLNSFVPYLFTNFQNFECLIYKLVLKVKTTSLFSVCKLYIESRTRVEHLENICSKLMWSF